MVRSFYCNSICHPSVVSFWFGVHSCYCNSKCCHTFKNDRTSKKLILFINNPRKLLADTKQTIIHALAMETEEVIHLQIAPVIQHLISLIFRHYVIQYLCITPSYLSYLPLSSYICQHLRDNLSIFILFIHTIFLRLLKRKYIIKLNVFE